MGCSGSRQMESPLSRCLEQMLVQAVVAQKRRKSFKVKKSSFNNLMLQMPKLVAGFNKIRDAYAAATGGTGKTTWGAFRALAASATRTPQTSLNGELPPPPQPPPVNAGQCGGGKAAAGGLGLGLDPGSSTLGEVLSLQGLGHGVADSTPMTHGDLIILYTVVYLIDSSHKRQTFTYPEIRSCLDLMEKSFMFFDSSADGRIERRELAMALKSGTRVFGRRSSRTLADQLFDQLDWSKDGAITFREFLLGMERIIMEAAGDEEAERMDPEEDELLGGSGELFELEREGEAGAEEGGAMAAKARVVSVQETEVLAWEDEEADLGAGRVGKP